MPAARREHHGTYVDPAGYRWAAVWFSSSNNLPLTPLYLRATEDGSGPATHTVTLVCPASQVRLYLCPGFRIPVPCEGELVRVR